jgi:type IV pilus assembly protein PilM
VTDPGAVGTGGANPGTGTAPADAAAPEQGPTGPGWVIQLKGYHYHNPKSSDNTRGLYGAQYVKETLIRGLEGLEVPVELPDPSQPGQMERVSMEELGISFPVLIDPGRIRPVQLINPNAEGAMGGSGTMGPGYMEEYGGYEEEGVPGISVYPGGRTGGMTASEEDEDAESPVIDLMQFDFTVEFAWQPRLPSERKQGGQPAAPEAPESEAQP